ESGRSRARGAAALRGRGARARGGEARGGGPLQAAPGDMERALVAKHVIASSNLFLGTSNFIVLALPREYGIGQTINPTEVNATHLARGAAWVVDGRCSHFVRSAGGPSLELLLVAERGVRRPSWVANGAATLVGGHDGV